jgi:hypothetical protein
MARGSAPGERRGGRRKGSLNKINSEVAEQLASLGCNPIEGMARIALGQVTCSLCRGAKSAWHKDGKAVPPGTEGAVEGACAHCFGTGLEPVGIDLAAKMYAELAQYVAPKRKAVEVSGPGGGPVESTLNLAALTAEQRAQYREILEALRTDRTAAR